MHMVLPWWWGVAVVVRWRAWVCGDRHGGGLGLWIGVVEVWVYGSEWWRSEFMDRRGGGCGFVVIGVYGGHRQLWWSMEAVGCGRGLCLWCGSWLWLRCGSQWLWVESFWW